MEINEQQLNRILALIDSKVDTAVATKLQQLIPDRNVQNTTAFEHIFMKGYKCGNPLQQGTFREFLRRCHIDMSTYQGNDGISVNRNNNTGVVTISGLSLHNAIALCSTLAFKRISANGTYINATKKDDDLIIDSNNGVTISTDQSTNKITLGLSLSNTLYGGQSSIWERPEMYPIYTDEIITDDVYPTKFVKITSSNITADFNSLKFPVYDFTIICENNISHPVDITSKLTSKGIIHHQQNVSFQPGYMYKFYIYNVNDASTSTGKYHIAYYNEISSI